MHFEDILHSLNSKLLRLLNDNKVLSRVGPQVMISSLVVSGIGNSSSGHYYSVCQQRDTVLASSLVPYPLSLS